MLRHRHTRTAIAAIAAALVLAALAMCGQVSAQPPSGARSTRLTSVRNWILSRKPKWST